MPVSNPQTDKVDIAKASRMWKLGSSASKIGDFFDVTKNVIIGLATRNRELFPAKQRSKAANEKIAQNNASLIDEEIVAEMWANEKTSQEIADRFGVTRRAIVRVVERDRHKFPKRPRGGIYNQKNKERKSKQKDAVLEFKPPSHPYDASRIPFSKTLMDLKAFECKAPLNDGSPLMFCADKATGAYCIHHAHRFFRPTA